MRNYDDINVKIDIKEVLSYLGLAVQEGPDPAAVRDDGSGADGFGILTAASGDEDFKNAAAAVSSWLKENADGGRNENIADQLMKAAGLILENARPRSFYTVSDIKKSDGNIYLGNSSIKIPGLDAGKLLGECSSCIIMAATLGGQVDRLIRRYQVSDMGMAVILNSCAAAGIESVCNELKQRLESEYEARGLYLTMRYSPGYGDMPLSLQADLCRLLQTEKRLGISVTPGMALLPSKSVTAIIGISDRPQLGSRGYSLSCDSCRAAASCLKRRSGGKCGYEQKS